MADPVPATATVTTSLRSDPNQSFCPPNKDFWTCLAGPFRGCCSHDPCHGGLCHDLDEVREYFALRKREVARREATTTITYTLVPVGRGDQSAMPVPATAAALNLAGKGNPKPAPATFRVPGVVTPKDGSTTAFKPVVVTTSTSSSSVSATGTVNPTAAPVAGSKKSGKTIAGIAVGVIVTVIIVALLCFLCIARCRRRASSKKHSSVHARKRSVGAQSCKGEERNDVGAMRAVEDELLSPMTPGGERLEAQRGRMLEDAEGRERWTGFRTVGMSAAEKLSDEFALAGSGPGRDSLESVPRLMVPVLPVPAVKTTSVNAVERPASHVGVGLGALGIGLVHPAYRGGTILENSNVPGPRRNTYELSSTRSENDLPALARLASNSSNVSRSPQSADVARRRSKSSVSSDDRRSKTESWTPGNDILNVFNALMPAPLNISVAQERQKQKPQFGATTSKWASVASPDSLTSTSTGPFLSPNAEMGILVRSWGIGQAVSTPTGMGLSHEKPSGGAGEQYVKKEDGGNVDRDEVNTAISTENEITSPVGDGGLRKPVRRNVYRGF